MASWADIAARTILAAHRRFGDRLLIATGAWAGTEISAIVSATTEQDELGRTIRRDVRTIEVPAEALPHLAAGVEIALLDASGAEIERRVVQGDPEWADSRRLTALIDTRPV